MSEKKEEECLRRRRMLPRNGRGDGPGGRFFKERPWRMSLKLVMMKMMVLVMMKIGSHVISIL